MFERTNFPDKYTADLFSDAAQFAEHGAGGDNLDFPIPQLGEWVVKKMRSYVSINGASRDAFERAASAWVVKLYQREAERSAKSNPLLVGG
jgi:predicted esterase